MASPVQWTTARLESTASPRQPADLPDELLVEIFLRVASYADLARASTACVSFRRLVADPSFLRRYRSLHPPLLLGFLGAERDGFEPAEAPHPNAPAARALHSAAGFSFEYLPSSGKYGWGPCDAGDGRVLLERGHVDDSGMFAWPDLAVCDPLSRQYLLLPRTPEDLLASVKIMERNASSVDASASLVPSGDWGEISFRVLRTVQTRTNLVVFIFCSTPGCWSVGASATWDVLSLNIPLPRQNVLERPQFAYGCCYWKVRNQNKLLKLDMNTMEFSTVDLPPDHARENIAIVEASEGSLGIFSLISHDILGTTVDYYIFMQNVSGRAKEWHMKNTTPLPDNSIYYFIGSAEGYVFLARLPLPEFNSPLCPEYVCFSLEIKTFNIERFSRMGSPAYCPYFGFPPSMSPRRIQGYEVMQG